MVFTKENIDRAKSAGGSSTAHAHAKRMLAKWAGQDPEIKVDEETIYLFCALQHVKTGDGYDGRVTPDLLKKWQSKEDIGVKWKQTVIVVWRRDNPNLNQTHKKCILGPEMNCQWPRRVTPQDVRVLRQSCPKDDLDDFFEVEVVMQVSKSSSSSAVLLKGLEDEDQDVQAQDDLASNPETFDIEVSQPARRQLAKNDSELPIPEDVATELLQSTVEDFEAGRIFHPDRQYPKTVEVKLRDYVLHLKTAKAEIEKKAPSGDESGAQLFDALQPHMQAYLKGVVKMLLTGPHYCQLHRLVPCMMEMPDLCEQTGTPIVNVLKSIVDTPLDSNAQIDFAGLRQDQRDMVHNSALYTDYFDNHRISFQLKKAKEAVHEPHKARLQATSDLYQVVKIEADQKSCQVAMTYFGPADKASKIKFFIADESHINYLLWWCPNTLLTDLRWAVGAKLDYTNATTQEILRMACMLKIAPEAVAEIKNPVVKKLVQMYLTMHKECVAKNQDDIPSPLRAAYAEVCGVRLGCKITKWESQPSFDGIPHDLMLKVAKGLLGSMKKFDAEKAPLLAKLSHRFRRAERFEKLLTTSMQRNSKAHRRRQNLVLMHRDCFAKMNRMQNRHQNSTILSARRQ